jgi:hypothetical protein
MRRSALTSIVAAAMFLVLVGLLHVIKPELSPSWRFVSEYAIGRHGWVMTVAFFAWAVSCATLAVALHGHAATRRARIGRLLLFVVSAALVVAGVFDQDPVTAKPADATTHGLLHAIASMIGIPGIPVAALLIGGRWSHATWLSLVTMAAYLLLAVPRAGGFGPDVLAGWMNRLVVLSYLAWQISMGYAVYTSSSPGGES